MIINFNKTRDPQRTAVLSKGKTLFNHFDELEPDTLYLAEVDGSAYTGFYLTNQKVYFNMPKSDLNCEHKLIAHWIRVLNNRNEHYIAKVNFDQAIHPSIMMHLVTFGDEFDIYDSLKEFNEMSSVNQRQLAQLNDRRHDRTNTWKTVIKNFGYYGRLHDIYHNYASRKMNEMGNTTVKKKLDAKEIVFSNTDLINYIFSYLRGDILKRESFKKIIASQDD